MKVLVVKLSSLGDLFHALPAVHLVKQGLNAEIDWVVNRQYAPLVECFTDINRVIPFPRHSLLKDMGSLISDLRKDRYDLVLDMQGLLKSAAVARLAHSKRRIGPSFHRECAHLLYTDVAGKRNKDRHAIEENMDVVRFLGFKTDQVIFPVTFPAVPDRLAGRVGTMNDNSQCVAMLPASRWATKNWPLAKYSELARMIVEQLKATVILLGGRDDQEYCNEIESGLVGKVINLAGQVSLPEMGAILREVDLLISNDSGPTHMAAAVGTRVLVVFGPTEKKRTGPYGPENRVIELDLPCRPCLSRRCLTGDLKCLESVTVEQVFAAASEILNIPA